FFQAEDGIRDSSVTGVQTCALPIFPWKICAVSSVVEHYLDTVGVTGSNPVSRTIITLRSLTIGGAVCRGYASARLPDCKVVRARSEERRVGKECMSRRVRE